MAANGEEVIITKSGIPVARLIGYETKDALRQPGSLRGEVRIKNTFDKPLPRKLLALFEGKS